MNSRSLIPLPRWKATNGCVQSSLRGSIFIALTTTDAQYLVSGGSTSVGLFMIPLLKLAGLKVIATASPRSFDLVKQYGADHVVDYHDVDKAVAEIKDVTGGGVWKGLECVGGDDNFKLSAQAFGEEGGQLTTLTLIPEGADKIRDNVKIDRVLLYTVGGYVSPISPRPAWCRQVCAR
jgi:NADPH:quinone reductase-like Zn-dependent oxidoreductase